MAVIFQYVLVFSSLQPKYWCGSSTVDVGYEDMSDSENEKNFERDRSGAKIGISVQHLRKVSIFRHLLINTEILHKTSSCLLCARLK